MLKFLIFYLHNQANVISCCSIPVALLALIERMHFFWKSFSSEDQWVLKARPNRVALSPPQKAANFDFFWYA